MTYTSICKSARCKLLQPCWAIITGKRLSRLYYCIVTPPDLLQNTIARTHRRTYVTGAAIPVGHFMTQTEFTPWYDNTSRGLYKMRQKLLLSVD